jgi:hypothetical protein
MIPPDLQEQCELGQRQLMQMEYLAAVATLSAAERRAWEAKDWDSLSRLLMPLQEARRQCRQRCGEGMICLDLLAQGPDSEPDAAAIVEQIPQGQLLIAGWGNIEPAVQLRQLAAQRGLYLETFLAAAYPIQSAALAVAIVPLSDAAMPAAKDWDLPSLSAALPPHSLLLQSNQLPRGRRHATAQTYGEVLSFWERLHAPFLAQAEAQTEPIKKMQAYRRALQVDPACELAHQRMADVAKQLSHAPPNRC